VTVLAQVYEGKQKLNSFGVLVETPPVLVAIEVEHFPDAGRIDQHDEETSPTAM